MVLLFILKSNLIKILKESKAPGREEEIDKKVSKCYKTQKKIIAQKRFYQGKNIKKKKVNRQLDLALVSASQPNIVLIL